LVGLATKVYLFLKRKNWLAAAVVVTVSFYNVKAESVILFIERFATV
jgi:hypothetical protein